MICVVAMYEVDNEAIPESLPIRKPPSVLPGRVIRSGRRGFRLLSFVEPSNRAYCRLVNLWIRACRRRRCRLYSSSYLANGKLIE